MNSESFDGPERVVAGTAKRTGSPLPGRTSPSPCMGEVRPTTKEEN